MKLGKDRESERKNEGKRNRSANREGVSKQRRYGNEGFNYGWIHYQIKAKDLLSVYVVFGDGLIPGDSADPCEYLFVSLLTTNMRSVSCFALFVKRANWD